ncbi:response regulator [Thermodesulfovibrio sp.]|uniref:response regulator n=1 Tax=Thermodesulfovibrio sp. TaxID=2067987 RepID=UPI0030B0F722
MKKKALVIEDNGVVSETIKAMLEFLEFQVDLADSGTDGIEKYVDAKNTGQPFDVVFVDLVLPEMHGSMIIKELKNIDPQVNAVISSGYSEDPSIRDYKNLGFKGVLNKPYTLDELRNVLNELGLL